MVIIALLAHTGSGTDLEIYPSKRTYLMAGNLVFATDKAAKKESLSICLMESRFSHWEPGVPDPEQGHSLVHAAEAGGCSPNWFPHCPGHS